MTKINTWPRNQSTGPDGGLSTGPDGGISTGPGGGMSTGSGGGMADNSELKGIGCVAKRLIWEMSD